LTFEVFTVVTM